jgi:hypothetical protein
MVKKSEPCECCGRPVATYQRSIYDVMAATLIEAAVSTEPGEWFHLPTLSRMGGDNAKMRFWGLIEEEMQLDPDKGRSGWWRVTPLGRQFVNMDTTVPRYVDVRLNKVLQFHGGAVTITDVLGESFDYKTLMGIS